MAKKRVLIAISVLATSVVIVGYMPRFAVSGSLTWTFLALYIAQASASWIFAVVIYPYFLSPLRNLPSPHGGHLFMGHSLQLIDHPLGGLQRDWLNTIRNDGVLYYRMIWNAARVMPTTPKAISEVLLAKSYDFIKPQESRDFLAPALGIGILLAEGDEHKRQRKALMPAFHYRHVRNLYPTFWEQSQRMVEAIALEANGTQSTVSISDWVTRAALDVIGSAGLGQSFHAIEEPQNELHQAYNRMFSASPLPRHLRWLRLLVPSAVFRKIPLQRNHDAAKAIKTVRDTARNIIRSRQPETTSSDILSVALASGGFSEDDLVNQLMTFLAAGHETTASAMMWAAWLLCRHPEVQQRLRGEIFDKLPSISSSTEQSVSSADFDEMPYLNAVCNEVLRLYPPVPYVLRGASKDTRIVGHYIPKGTVIVLPIWAINNNKELWGMDAEEFNPARWMAPGQAKSGGADSNYSYMTFLHGPRSCIGQSFAKAEFQCLLASLVGRFDLKPVPGDNDLRIVGDLTNKPRGGTWALLTELPGR